MLYEFRRFGLSTCNIILFFYTVLSTQSCIAEDKLAPINIQDTYDNSTNISNPLSLKKVIELAIENNPKVKSAIATLPVAEAKLVITKYIPNPIVGANSELIKSGSTHPLQIGQSLELGRKRYWRVQVAKNEVSKTELEIAKVLWETRAKAHISYAILSVSKNLIDLANARLNFYNSLLEIAEKRFHAGDASGLEIDRTNMELLSAENDLDEAGKKLKRATVELNGLLGQQVDTQLILEDSEKLKPKTLISEYQPIRELINKAVEKRLEAAILEKDYGITRARLKKARWERIPNLYVEGGPARPSFHDNIWGPYIGTQVELPVFNRKQGEIKEAKAQLEYLDKEKIRIENEINIEVKNALQDLELSEKQVGRFEQNLLGQSEDILDAIKKGYQIGKLTLTDVLNAEQKNRDLKQKYLESLLNYQIALASLEYAVGVPIYEQ